MVTPPALRAATEALLHLQTSKTAQPNTANKQRFSSELARQLGQQSTHAQNNTIVQSLSRPAVFLPIAAEFGPTAQATNSTQRRDKKSKAAQATTAYSSAIRTKK